MRKRGNKQMKMYLVVTTCTDDAPIYRLYKTHTAAIEDFWSRVGSYVHDWLIDCTDFCDGGRVSAEKAVKLFEKCYAEKDTEYVSFDDMEIYIEELEVED